MKPFIAPREKRLLMVVIPLQVGAADTQPPGVGLWQARAPRTTNCNASLCC